MVERTVHRVIAGDSRDLSALPDDSIDLIVTSPPYPMVEMWDGLFSELNPEIGTCLKKEDGDRAFEKMHLELDRVWSGLPRVVRQGGVVCINVGDATRRMGDDFRLYSNHARMISKMKEIGFSELPEIVWRKQTNAPNKFMGSGMLPNGAYVTLEHEFILIFRKGGKRRFSTEDNERRYESAYFWEERNEWFSDLWTIVGSKQRMKSGSSRERSAAYPMELAYRLVNMFSIKGDTVLDPFLGLGSTTLACMASGRNSVGYEIDGDIVPSVVERMMSFKDEGNDYVQGRLRKHAEFIAQREGETAHENDIHRVPVITKQETRIRLDLIDDIKFINGEVIVEYF
jgi:modification methylase